MLKKNFNKLVTSIYEESSRRKITEYLGKLLYEKQEGYNARQVVFLCIGSDRYTGDAMGPLVGSYLMEKIQYPVYGYLDKPVHAGNLSETVLAIKEKYYSPIIIAIDACLGTKSEVGNIEIWDGGLEAGIAVGNKLPRVGDISVIGVVNTSGQLAYLALQSTPLSLVMKLTKIISEAITDVACTKTLH